MPTWENEREGENQTIQGGKDVEKDVEQLVYSKRHWESILV